MALGLTDSTSGSVLRVPGQYSTASRTRQRNLVVEQGCCKVAAAKRQPLAREA